MKKTNIVISILVVSSILASGCSLKSLAKIDANSKDAITDNVKSSSQVEKQNDSVNKKEVVTKADNSQKQINDEKNQKVKTSNSNDSGNISSTKVERVIPKSPSKSNAQENIQISNNVKQVQVTNNVAKPSNATYNSTTIQNTINSNTATKNGEGAVNAQGMPSYNYTASSYAEYYNIVYNSMKNFDDNVYIKINNYDSKTYNLDVINKIFQQHYDIDYGFSGADATLYYMGNVYILNINYKYNLPKTTMITMRDKVQSKAQSIISQLIKPGMNNVQKELAVHDYIVNSTVYDYDNYVKGTLSEDDFTDYGVVINGKAVCEGYAKALQRLLSMCGIESLAVEGQASGVPHAWNLVNINGVYTHVDSTWDDPVTQNRQNILSHDYFNVSDAEIAADHQWNKSLYPSGVQIK